MSYGYRLRGATNNSLFKTAFNWGPKLYSSLKLIKIISFIKY